MTVLLVAAGSAGTGDFDGVDDRFDLVPVEDLEEDDREEDPDLAVVGEGSVAAAVERLAAPIVAATDDPAAALDAGADEVVPPDAPVELLERRVRSVLERRRLRERERVGEGRDAGTGADGGAPVAPPTRRLRTIVDNLPIVLFAIDDDGAFTLSEGRGLEKLGLDAGEIVGKSIADVYGGNEEILAAVDRALDGEHVNHVVAVDDLAFETWYRPVVRDGSARSVIGAAIDVTEQVERERELERYRTLVEAVGDPVYVLDAEGFIEMVNEAMARHLGYDREQLVGEHVSLVLTEDSVAEGEELIADLLADDDRRWGTCELMVVDADGDVTLYEDNIGIITDDGALVGSVGVIRDVSERVERERELEQYETIVETVPDGVFVIDEDGIIVGGNRTSAEMLGYEYGELEGEPFVRLVEDGVIDRGFVDRYDDIVRELLSSDADVERAKYEFEATILDARERYVEGHLRLRPYDDEFRGTIGINRDITDRKERERQLRRQNERLEEFASVVSHDLRNPLNVARGTVDLLAEDVDAEGLETVRDSLERMDELIENLLALAHEGQSVTEPASVALGVVVGDAWSSVAAEDAGLVVETDATVLADRSRLRQLLENLLGNSVDHGGPGVRIEVGTLDDGHGFYVADDGPGVPEDEREDVFEYGYTTRSNGTGFGLAIVRTIAEAHGWDVRVTESDAGGARFEFTGVEFAD